jgi:hypothetical protein
MAQRAGGPVAPAEARAAYSRLAGVYKLIAPDRGGYLAYGPTRLREPDDTGVAERGASADGGIRRLFRDVCRQRRGRHGEPEHLGAGARPAEPHARPAGPDRILETGSDRAALILRPPLIKTPDGDVVMTNVWERLTD